jgi:hypothetical protein
MKRTISISLVVVAATLFVFRAADPPPVYADSDEYQCSYSLPSGTQHQTFVALGHPNAVATCQNIVNQGAINYCQGVGNSDPFVVQYTTVYFPDGWGRWDTAQLVDSNSVTFKCVDGWAVYP